MDIVYWSGNRHGGCAGRGSSSKTRFVAALQCISEERPIATRMVAVTPFARLVLFAWTQRRLVPSTTAAFDGLTCFSSANGAECSYVAISALGQCADLGWWVNTVLGNVKNAIHRLIMRYGGSIFGDTFHFNRRIDSPLHLLSANAAANLPSCNARYMISESGRTHVSRGSAETFWRVLFRN